MKERACPKCGGKEFLASQVVRMEVVVDGYNEFLRNNTENAVESIYNSDKPYGPYVCKKCGEEIGNLNDLESKESEPPPPKGGGFLEEVKHVLHHP